jgi:hypothetical protein
VVAFDSVRAWRSVAWAISRQTSQVVFLTKVKVDIPRNSRGSGGPAVSLLSGPARSEEPVTDLESVPWMKVLNPTSSQREGQRKMFEKKRAVGAACRTSRRDLETSEHDSQI